MHNFKYVRFVHFLEAFWKLLKSGKKTLPKEEIQKRLDICIECPSGAFNGSRCEKCECCINEVQSVFNKAAYPTERCPDGHWLEIEVKNEMAVEPVAPVFPSTEPELVPGPDGVPEGSESLVSES